MLKGIDVSSWQGDIDVSKLAEVEFIISKATEGTSYVNPYCDKVIQQCIRQGLPWGFYHYMKGADPVKEADHFIDSCLNYFGHGIPVLDWEENQGVQSVNQFVRRVYERTDVWPWIYANPWRFNQGGVEPNCGRWVASYPSNKQTTLDTDPGSIPRTDGLVCCWQYSSNGRVIGFTGPLDLNHFYGDREAWKLYSTKGGKVEENSTEQPKTETLENEHYKVTIERK